MPHVARTSLAALALCLVLDLAVGIPAASAQPAPSGRTWTDPPARKTDAEKSEAEKPVAEAPRAATPESVPAPMLAATPKSEPSKVTSAKTATAKAVARSARSARVVAAPRRRERPVAVARRVVPAPKRVATAPRRTRVAVAPRIRAERAPRIAVAAPVPRVPRDEAFTGYRPSDFGLGYADDRLERLRAAEAAGFLIVRRRSVEFPDGRSLRTYQPREDSDGF